MSEQLNLAQRIAKASATVGGKLQTDKKNKQDNYDYISSDKILAVVGQAMADCGVVVFPAVVEHDLQLGQSSGGKTRYDVRVKFDMTISDGVSTMTMPWFGVGADYAAPDKATYKAITSGHKYFLAKLFCIGVGNEDGEHESEEPTQQVKKTTVSPTTERKEEKKEEKQTTPHPAAKVAIKDGSLKTLHGVGARLYGDNWDVKRHELVASITEGRTNSSSELYEDEAQKLIVGISNKLQEFSGKKQAA